MHPDICAFRVRPPHGKDLKVHRASSGGVHGTVKALHVMSAALPAHAMRSPDVGAHELADAGAELGHGAVVLRAAEQAHVRVGQRFRHRQRLAVRRDERPCADVPYLRYDAASMTPHKHTVLCSGFSLVMPPRQLAVAEGPSFESTPVLMRSTGLPLLLLQNTSRTH